MSLHAGSPGHAVDRHDGQRTEETHAATAEIESIPVKRRRPAQPERRRHHDDFRGAHRAAVDRHARRRRERARSRDGAGPPAAVRTSMPGAVSSANVTAIAEDRGGNFWIGTDGGGLDLARADGTVVKVFRHDPDDPASFPVNTVYALAVDARGSGLGRRPMAAASCGSAARARPRTRSVSRPSRARRGSRATRCTACSRMRAAASG